MVSPAPHSTHVPIHSLSSTSLKFIQRCLPRKVNRYGYVAGLVALLRCCTRGHAPNDPTGPDRTRPEMALSSKQLEIKHLPNPTPDHNPNKIIVSPVEDTLVTPLSRVQAPGASTAHPSQLGLKITEPLQVWANEFIHAHVMEVKRTTK